MKSLILIVLVTIIGCSPSKNHTNVSMDEPGQEAGKESVKEVPECLQKMIKEYRAEKKQNPPKSIYSYLYKGQTVYYVSPPCCDFFSDLFDSNCVLIGHPDGGFTGRGDGKITDFRDSAKDEKLIWKDERK